VLHVDRRPVPRRRQPARRASSAVKSRFSREGADGRCSV